MIMKLKYILPLMALLSLSSCLKDDSVGAVNDVSKIEILGDFEKSYTLDRWEVLKLTAPEIKQSKPNKAVKYEWEIDNKVVSTEKDLNYTCSEFGKFPCRLKITNGDEIHYLAFALDVRYSYIQGLYILAQKDKEFVLSYLPEEDTKKAFQIDVLKKNNKTLNFTAKPTALHYVETLGKQLFYLATAEPNMLYEFDANLMLNTRRSEAKGKITSLAGEQSMLYTITDGKLISIKQGEIYFTNYENRGYEKEVGAINLANPMVHFKTPEGRYTHGFVMFDNAGGHILANKAGNGTKMPNELLKDKFKGMELISMVAVDKGRQIAMFLADKATKAMKQVLFSPGHYVSSWSSKPSVEAEIKYEGAVPSDVGIGKGSIFVSAPKRDLIYYSNANQLYGYSTLSNGNYDKTPIFSCATGETIVDMFVTKDETKLFIATNSPSGELKGNIYCLNIADNANQLLWKKEHLTGSITQIFYRGKK